MYRRIRRGSFLCPAVLSITRLRSNRTGGSRSYWSGTHAIAVKHQTKRIEQVINGWLDNCQAGAMR